MWGGEPFSEPLRAAYAEGRLPKERLSEMVRRILRSMFAIGIDRWEGKSEVDMALHNEIALETARQGTVLLKNDGALPLPTGTSARIAVIGGHAQVGVLTGCGSSAVTPPGGYAEEIKIGGPGGMGVGRNLYLLAVSPRRAEEAASERELEFDPGMTPTEAAIAAARADVAIVFGIRVEGEGFDNPDLSLPWGQDAVIDAVAAANPNMIVVLETGNPVCMPWHEKARAIVQAWYPGQAGGRAIAEILTGTSTPRAGSRSPSRRTRANSPRRAARSRHAVGYADDDRVQRGRRGRIPLARQNGRGAPIRVWARPELHHLRL